MKATKNHFISLFILLAFVFGVTTALAQEDDVIDESAETSRCETLLANGGTPEQMEYCERWQAQVNDYREQHNRLLEEKRAEMQNNIQDRQSELDSYRTGIQEQVETRRDQLQENIAERKSFLSERAKQRIINLAANMSNQFDAASNRLQNIIDRISSRIQKLNERGIDTEEAESHLTDAQDAVNAAKTQLEDIDALVNNAVSSENPRSAWQTVKTEYLSIKENLKSSHASLRQAVAALKSAVAEAGSDTGVSDAVRNNDTTENGEANTDSE